MAFESSLRPGVVASTPDESKIYYSSAFDKKYSGPVPNFSFADVQASMIFPFVIKGDSRPPIIELKGLTLISISEHRDKFPVVAFGNKGIKGYTYGHKTTAGALGFNVFGSSPFSEAIAKYASWIGVGSVDFITPDELPPFHINLTFVGANGESSTQFLKSVTITDSSKNLSIDGVKMTDAYSYMAASCTTLMQTRYESIGTPFNPIITPLNEKSSFLDVFPAPIPSFLRF